MTSLDRSSLGAAVESPLGARLTPRRFRVIDCREVISGGAVVVPGTLWGIQTVREPGFWLFGGPAQRWNAHRGTFSHGGSPPSSRQWTTVSSTSGTSNVRLTLDFCVAAESRATACVSTSLSRARPLQWQRLRLFHNDDPAEPFFSETLIDISPEGGWRAADETAHREATLILQPGWHRFTVWFRTGWGGRHGGSAAQHRYAINLAGTETDP